MGQANSQVQYITPRYIEQNAQRSFAVPIVSDGTSMTAHEAALVGKAGEALVAAELLRRHIDVAYPAHDGGIDLFAYCGHDLTRVVPIQVKARTSTCFEFQKDWFRIEGSVLIQVWYVTQTPEFYIFGGLEDVEEVLGTTHASTQSWTEKGGYNVTNPSRDHIERMQIHRNRWERIIARLKVDMRPVPEEYARV